MEKANNSIKLIGVGIAVGVLLVVVVMFIIKASPSKFILGPIEFEIPTQTSESINHPQASTSENNTNSKAENEVDVKMTETPNITHAGRAAGCFCEPSDCSGIRVIKGDNVPASSILEPHAGSRGILYQYLEFGKAEVSGNLWVYVDIEGNPASENCIESQLQNFRYEELKVIGTP